MSEDLDRSLGIDGRYLPAFIDELLYSGILAVTDAVVSQCLGEFWGLEK
jgi:hypothetical protein